MTDPSAFTDRQREALAEFPLMAALLGRRSRRFPMGGEIPDGPLAYRSEHDHVPLSELETLLILAVMGGTTGWHFGITRHERYAPHLANYNGAAAGRTIPSAAGFHTAELFYTDDSGLYFMPTRDAGALVHPEDEEEITAELMVARHRDRVLKLSGERLHLPRTEPYLEGHNTWIANEPGSLLVIPVADIAQHHIANLCFFAQNGYCVYDDINQRPVPGLEEFDDLVDTAAPIPLSFVEQYSLTEATAELMCSSYNGALLLQAMGLGGWSFDGIEHMALLGASGEENVPGLGFRYDTDPRWGTPNPTGRTDGTFHAFCPPHFATMADAVAAFAERKFGPGGPYHPETPGPWLDSRGVRASAERHDERFLACVTRQCDYTLETWGKFPGTVPSVWVMNFLQAQHIDLDFYDRFFRPGAYLDTHRRHFEVWH
ncbi:MAG TPA: hypothetical protein VG186_08735 [Solirubrobacteraceae bacterium]|jgi:hypothetical protein|nr:hypothetical protein [Solirubrobacteraceae bacterium]